VNERRVWIVGGDANATNRDLISRWTSRGMDVRSIAPDAVPGRVGPNDIAIGRIDVRSSLDGVEPGLLALHELVRRGVHVLNRPGPILAAHDKLRTARALAARRTPHPRTAHLAPGGPVTLEPPLVVKPRFGSWGLDVYRCLTDDNVADVLEVISGREWFRRGGAVVQEYVPNAGHDLRVLVAGGQVVGASRRVAEPGEWRTNVYLGATKLPADLTPEARALAVAAVDALGGDLFGVDLLPLPDNRYVVIEVNAAVDFDHRYSLGERDVHADVAFALDLFQLAPTSDEMVARLAQNVSRAMRAPVTQLGERSTR
jgi:[lysine-biosynthesis-protein LysW]---L-2-aminoadipate ligase